MTDRRQTDRQTDGRAIAYSEREREFTFAKKLTKRIISLADTATQVVEFFVLSVNFRDALYSSNLPFHSISEFTVVTWPS